MSLGDVVWDNFPYTDSYSSNEKPTADQIVACAPAYYSRAVQYFRDLPVRYKDSNRFSIGRYAIKRKNGKCEWRYAYNLRPINSSDIFFHSYLFIKKSI